MKNYEDDGRKERKSIRELSHCVIFIMSGVWVQCFILLLLRYHGSFSLLCDVTLDGKSARMMIPQFLFVLIGRSDLCVLWIVICIRAIVDCECERYVQVSGGPYN
jgi:hypothetical protein